jgi:hypothetical protein
MHNGTVGGLFAAALLTAATSAAASPWLDLGDNQMRGDVALLAASGIIDDVTTQWPLPAASVIAELADAPLEGASEAVAANRLGRRLERSGDPLTVGMTLDATNRPATVYGFDSLGREKGQAQFTLDFNGAATWGHLALGAISADYTGRGTKWMLDGSYLAQQAGPLVIYGGYLSHWWGPGWISALSLSNNARPMPQIGFTRASSAASHWPVLRWLGPWQVEFFVGYLDGPRVQKHTYYNALHFTFNPAPGLEIGLSRTEQFCGQGHPCVPLRDYFDLANDPAHSNRTNDQGTFAIKYSHALFGTPAEIYLQVMNEDSSPFTHSGSSHLFGGSLFLPVASGPLRLTAEYTDSVATADIFSFGDVFHGFAYNNGTYVDGMRYRGRTLGFSLDSDSRLFSLQAAWSDSRDWFYELSLHHAVVSNPHNSSGNAVTAAPFIANIAELRLGLPLGGFRLDLAGRLADDQPRPGKGADAAIEARLHFNL